MSNYISSLIDPLFRQARRFSESSRSSPTQDTASREPGPNTAAGDGNGDVIYENTSRQRRGTWTGGGIVALQSRSHAVSPTNHNGNLLISPSMDHITSSERLHPSSPHLLLQNDTNYADNHHIHGISERSSQILDRSDSHDERHGQDATGWEALESAPLTPGGHERSSVSILPADDGMSGLRHKIQTVQKLEIPGGEKARLVHGLMTERYRSIRLFHDSKFTAAGVSSRGQSQERPWTVASSPSKQSFEQLSLTPSSLSSEFVSTGPYYLSTTDFEPTYVPQHHRHPNIFENSVSVPGESTLDPLSEEDEDADALHLGCEHYRRNVKLQCHTCHRWYTCRFCHDAVEDHLLERRRTENMLCMVCKSAQPASQWCKSCGIMAASYYCSVCKLWDNDGRKAIYHCNDCGICRRGQGLGKDFIHCKTCAVCIPISIEATHRCIESSTKCDCPICGDYMFTSPDSVSLMRCGHSMHQKCYDEYQKTSYRCPICTKTILNMETQFRNLDRAIEAQPMPPEYQDMAIVHCNDCRAKSLVNFHWLGLKCDVCESYNTSQLELQRSQTGNDHSSQVTQAGGTATTQIPGLHQQSSNMTSAFDAGPGSGPQIPSGGSENIHLSPSSVGQRRNVLASSPRISNYFGIDPRPEPTLQNRERAASGSSNSDEFWGSRLLNVIRNREFNSEDDGNDDDEDDDDDDSEVPEITSDGEDYGGEEDEDVIDIFGHR